VEYLRDLRFALTALRRSAGFSAVAIATLACGFALAATTIAVVNAYLVRALPYPRADRLYHVNYSQPGEREPGDIARLDWEQLTHVVEAIDYSAPARFHIGEGADRQEALGLAVAPGTNELLDIRAVTGRVLSADDYRADAESVVMLGYDLWRTRFGGQADVVGRTLHARRSNPAEPLESFRIVGVLPPGFRYARTYGRGDMEFAVPMREVRQAYMVRLRDGVEPAAAARAIRALIDRSATSFPAGWSGVQLESAHERYTGALRPMLLAITSAAAIVLIIVSVNLGVLMLLRALRRQKEIAVRVALGAGRGQIVRLLVAESAVICATALAAGLVLTAAALRALAPVIEERLGLDAPGGTSAIRIDGTVLFILFAAAVAISLLLSFMPLLASWRDRLAHVLRAATRGATDSPAMRGVRSGLIAVEVAASLALLVGCGLMIRTVINLVHTDLGYRTEQVVRLRVALPENTYRDAAAFGAFYDRLADRLAGRKGTFAFTNAIPFYEYPAERVEVEGVNTQVDANMMAATPSYFGVLGIAVREGRAFTDSDRANTEPVVIVSSSMARRLWPDGSAIGHRIRFEQSDRDVRAVWRTIVGVSSDVRQTHTDTGLNDVYLPFAQAPSRYAPVYARGADAQQWLALLREHVAAIDPDVVVTPATYAELADEEKQLLAAPRFLMSLLIAFGAFAALLATLGIWGVTAYAVQQRERELAVRSAVGATRGQLITLFLKDGGVVLIVGIAGGLFGAWAIGRMLQHELHGVRPMDAVTLLGAAALMLTAGLLASWWPAARAGNARNPIEVLNEG
jgi:putative ABC transport system permease protein